MENYQTVPECTTDLFNQFPHGVCWGSSHRWFCARSPGQHLYLQRQTHHGRIVGRMPLGCCRDVSDLVLFFIIMHTAHMLTFLVIIYINVIDVKI